ncbi:uncharacterized protein LOC130680517 isoform X2 [Manis pentadactyla]|uniref:uncharacterized protein LOC130680517 isoform X2 n=1 Tax=Manis pentadactyla TaxID=143292 RepID=UPI00255C4773|nr:uncharacterized protein LOC130680517 isoform X2 [Manis pentadactyla]
MLVPPAGTARFRCPPCFFPKVLSQTQQRKLPACARPLVSPAPPPPPSLAKAQAPSNSDRLRLPPAGSRGLPRQGPAPSSSRRPVLLAAAAHDPCRRHLARVPSFSRRPRQLAAASAHKLKIKAFCRRILLLLRAVLAGEDGARDKWCRNPGSRTSPAQGGPFRHLERIQNCRTEEKPGVGEENPFWIPERLTRKVLDKGDDLSVPTDPAPVTGNPDSGSIEMGNIVCLS